MKPFLTEEAAKKLAPCGPSQRNECVNSSIGTKVPKIRHYVGSESSDFSTAAAISQFNEGYGYVNQAAQLMGVAGNAVTEKHTKVMDKKKDRNSLKPWPNRVASSRKLRTWAYLRLRLARTCVDLRALALTCDDLRSLWLRSNLHAS